MNLKEKRAKAVRVLRENPDGYVQIKGSYSEGRGRCAMGLIATAFGVDAEIVEYSKIMSVVEELGMDFYEEGDVLPPIRDADIYVMNDDGMSFKAIGDQLAAAWGLE